MIALYKVKQNGKEHYYQPKTCIEVYTNYLRLLLTRFSKCYQFWMNMSQEFSYFIPEPRNFSEVTIFSEDIKKPCLKETLKEIKNVINDHKFLVQQPEKGGPDTSCMDFYK